MQIVKLLREGKMQFSDVLFFEDMFHPGLEALPYIFNQSNPQYRPRVYLRCLAQTVDPDDFVHVWGMNKWMSLYEKMVVDWVDGIIVASQEMLPFIQVAGWDVPLYVTGLPFGKAEVQSRVPIVKPFNQRQLRVTFAARWDQEKQPEFFLELARAPEFSHVTFTVVQGGPLRSNKRELVAEAREFARKEPDHFQIIENAGKNQYYEVLNDTRVLFNCALQDWVSNTVSEADALGANVLYPAYRSFPETFFNDHERLYVPWSLEDAKAKLKKLLLAPHPNVGKISDYQNKSIERTIDVLQKGQGSRYLVNPSSYRSRIRGVF
jgi:hypothetical protein